MTKRIKGLIPATVFSVVALVLPLTANTAFAQTQQVHERDVEFASQHPCTEELVEGDTTVHMTITTTNNPDGTMTVKVKQHTHGQQLLGVISQDWYTFNDAEDTEETFTLLGPAGSVSTKTIFIHTSEDVAFQEEPGLDDLHQRFAIAFSPLLPPTVVRDTSECK